MKHAWLLLFPCLLPAQNASFSLATATIAIGATAGSASVELVASSPTAAWTAVSNVAWLVVAPSSASGNGSAQIQFNYPANSSPSAQTGTLTIAGQTLTVTQAGSTAVPLSVLTTQIAQGLNVLNLPYGVALDGSGNLYIADTGNNAIQEWNASRQELTTLVCPGLNAPHGVAADGQGNVYIADSYNNAIKECNPSGQITTLVGPPSGLTSGSPLNFPLGVAVDGQGNVYIADFGNNAVEKWNSAQGLTTVVGFPNLNNPTGVAVDALGNVYIADFRDNAIKEWSVGRGLKTLVSQGLSFPNSVTLDGEGNVYFLDGNNNALKEWNASSQAVSTLVSSGVNGSFGVVTDGQGNFYIANTSTSSILKFSSAYFGVGSGNVTEGPQAGTDSVTVLVGASIPLTATSDQAWLTITSTTNGVIAFSFQANTLLTSRVAHITVMGQQITVTQTADVATNLTKSAGDGQSTPEGQPFPTLLQVTLTDTNGVPLQGAAVTFTVVPAGNGAGGTFAGSPPMPISTNAGGSATAPTLTANSIPGTFTVTATVNGLTATFSLTNTGSTYALASSSVLVGSPAGNGTTLLITSGTWTASSNVSWLQISPGSASGVGSALIQFSYSANTNPAAQIGTLTIAGLTFTVTQAGTTYVPAYPVTPLISSGLTNPQGVAVDGQGNLYIADTGDSMIKEWSGGSLQMLSNAQNAPAAVAVDGHGNVYIADTGKHAIEVFNAANNPTLTPLVSGLSNPSGVAVDGQGNVYFSDTGNNVIDEWNAANGMTTPPGLSGLSGPTGVAVDAEGNVYFADSGQNSIMEWNAASGLSTLPNVSGLSDPTGVAVDGQGNVYIADTGTNSIKEWNAGSASLATLVFTGLSSPMGVAVDGQGNIYIADTNDSVIKKLTPAYLALSASSLNEGAQAGTDSLTAQVLPAGTPLSPTSDQSWLTITGSTGGVIGFSFSINTAGTSRTAHITVLGIQVTVTQSGDVPANLTLCAGGGQSAPVGQPFATALQVCLTDAGGNPLAGWPVTFSVTPGATGAGGTFSATPPMPIQTNASGIATAPTLTANSIAGTFTVTVTVSTLSVTFTLTNVAPSTSSLGASSALVGSAAGSGSVLLLASGGWTATSNAAWLQLSAGSTSGVGSALIQFSYSANSNPAAQTGTLNIAGLTFTVTQAGAGYVPVYPVTTLISSGLKNPQGVAVDGQGNLYIADTGHNAIEEWSGGPLQTLSSAQNAPAAVAVDGHGNVYIADTGNRAIEVFNAANNPTLTNLVSGLSNPSGVAVDGQGNVYFSDTGNNVIDEWNAANGMTTPPGLSGLNSPTGVAVDAEGNVYFADSGQNSIMEWNAASGLSTLPGVSGLSNPTGVAVDGQDNVYIADTGHSAMKEWTAGNQQLLAPPALVSAGLSSPMGVAVDGQGNIYIADTNDSAIKKLTPAYLALSASSLNEGAQAGTGSVTAQVLPAGTALAPTSDQSWLTITGSAGGVIGFSFSTNTLSASRTAHITVLGLQVTVTQSGDTPASVTACAGNGQSTPWASLLRPLSRCVLSTRAGILYPAGR